MSTWGNSSPSSATTPRQDEVREMLASDGAAGLSTPLHRGHSPSAQPSSNETPQPSQGAGPQPEHETPSQSRPLSAEAPPPRNILPSQGEQPTPSDKMPPHTQGPSGQMHFHPQNGPGGQMSPFPTAVPYGRGFPPGVGPAPPYMMPPGYMYPPPPGFPYGQFYAPPPPGPQLRMLPQVVPPAPGRITATGQGRGAAPNLPRSATAGFITLSEPSIPPGQRPQQLPTVPRPGTPPVVRVEWRGRSTPGLSDPDEVESIQADEPGDVDAKDIADYDTGRVHPYGYSISRLSSILSGHPKSSTEDVSSEDEEKSPGSSTPTTTATAATDRRSCLPPTCGISESRYTGDGIPGGRHKVNLTTLPMPQSHHQANFRWM